MRFRRNPPPVFDPDTVVRCAQHLYRQAQIVTVRLIITFAFSGGVLSASVIQIVNMFADPPVSRFGQYAIPIGCVLVGGILGYLMGKAQALNLILQAQLALCQLEIEKNSRRESVATQERNRT